MSTLCMFLKNTRTRNYGSLKCLEIKDTPKIKAIKNATTISTEKCKHNKETYAISGNTLMRVSYKEVAQYLKDPHKYHLGCCKDKQILSLKQGKCVDAFDGKMTCVTDAQCDKGRICTDLTDTSTMNIRSVCTIGKRPNINGKCYGGWMSDKKVVVKTKEKKESYDVIDEKQRRQRVYDKNGVAYACLKDTKTIDNDKCKEEIQENGMDNATAMHCCYGYEADDNGNVTCLKGQVVSDCAEGESFSIEKMRCVSQCQKDQYYNTKHQVCMYKNETFCLSDKDCSKGEICKQDYENRYGINSLSTKISTCKTGTRTDMTGKCYGSKQNTWYKSKPNNKTQFNTDKRERVIDKDGNKYACLIGEKDTTSDKCLKEVTRPTGLDIDMAKHCCYGYNFTWGTYGCYPGGG